jgi:hypothetical protein
MDHYIIFINFGNNAGYEIFMSNDVYLGNLRKLASKHLEDQRYPRSNPFFESDSLTCPYCEGVRLSLSLQLPATSWTTIEWVTGIALR